MNNQWRCREAFHDDENNEKACTPATVGQCGESDATERLRRKQTAVNLVIAVRGVDDIALMQIKMKFLAHYTRVALNNKIVTLRRQDKSSTASNVIVL